MRTNIVLLGGNGYIGRAVTKQWLKKDPKAHFYVVSRSGKNQMKDSRIHNISADVTNYETVVTVIPEKVDYIVDFVGRPEKNKVDLEQINSIPAEVMKRLAEKHEVTAMGFIGGKLGPKSFTFIKAHIVQELKKSPIRLEVVEPTLVYGEDRNDSLAKIVPVFKFLGMFSKNLKPVKVTQVAEDLVAKMTFNKS